MRSYIDLYFTPGPVPPVEISKRLLRMAGISFIVGSHDLTFEWRTEEEFHARLSKIHAALSGTGVSYRVETIVQEAGAPDPVLWPPAVPRRESARPIS
jgi:hypothetical protein